MNKLSPGERILYEAMTKAPDRPWSVEDLASTVYKGNRPPSWRNSILVRMRWLSIKTDGMPLRVYRTTPIGRGKKAIYKIERQPDDAIRRGSGSLRGHASSSLKGRKPTRLEHA